VRTLMFLQVLAWLYCVFCCSSSSALPHQRCHRPRRVCARCRRLRCIVTLPCRCRCRSVRQGRAFLVRPPEGLCGIGSHSSPVWPAKVSCGADGEMRVLWECCLYKGLSSGQMVPSHHSNKSVSPLDCPIIAEVEDSH
jgi:hypothetical protein